MKEIVQGAMLVIFPGGFIAMLVAWLWIVVLAFRDSVAWGVFCFLLIPIALFYAATRGWNRCKRPLIIFGVGLLMKVGGIAWFAGGQ